MTIADAILFPLAGFIVGASYAILRPRGLCHVCRKPMRVWVWQAGDDLSPWHHGNPSCSMAITIHCLDARAARHRAGRP